MSGLIHQRGRHDVIAARIGGEEFAVLLPECDTDAAYGFAERLRAAVAAETFTPGGESQRITISIGIAELSSAHDSRAGLMAAADAALYRAKEEGRNRVCVESCPGSSRPDSQRRGSSARRRAPLTSRPSSEDSQLRNECVSPCGYRGAP